MNIHGHFHLTIQYFLHRMIKTFRNLKNNLEDRKDDTTKTRDFML